MNFSEFWKENMREHEPFFREGSLCVLENSELVYTTK